MPKSSKLEPVHPMMVESVALFNRMEEIQQEIARRAFELFEQRGREPGRDFEDWSTAESELLAAVPIDLEETDEAFKITTAVPGFGEKDIKIAAEPNRVFISGKVEEKQSEEGSGASLLNRMFFRGIDLPAAIDAEKAEARLKNEILTVTLPRAAVSAGGRQKAAKGEATKKAGQ